MVFRKGNSKQKQSSLERDGLPVMIGAVSGHGARVKSLVLFLFLAKNWPRAPGPGSRLKSLVLIPVLGNIFAIIIGLGAWVPAKIASFLPVFGQKLCEEEDKLA